MDSIFSRLVAAREHLQKAKAQISTSINTEDAPVNTDSPPINPPINIEIAPGAVPVNEEGRPVYDYPTTELPAGSDLPPVTGPPILSSPLPELDETENNFFPGAHVYTDVSNPLNGNYEDIIHAMNTVGVHPNQVNPFTPGEGYIGDVNIPGPFGEDPVTTTAIFDQNGNQIGIRNETLPGHPLHPGWVERILVGGVDGHIRIQTLGGGTGNLGGPNIWLDDLIWGGVDHQVEQALAPIQDGGSGPPAPEPSGGSLDDGTPPNEETHNSIDNNGGGGADGGSGPPAPESSGGSPDDGTPDNATNETPTGSIAENSEQGEDEGDDTVTTTNPSIDDDSGDEGGLQNPNISLTGNDTPASVDTDSITVSESPEGDTAGFSVNETTQSTNGAPLSEGTQTVTASTSDGTTVEGTPEEIQENAQQALQSDPDNPVLQDLAAGGSITDSAQEHGNEETVEAIDAIAEEAALAEEVEEVEESEESQSSEPSASTVSNQQTVNAQNTASDNQLIGLADSTTDTTGTTETTGSHETTGGDDHGDQDEESQESEQSEQSEPSESTQSESSASTQSSSSEPAGLTQGQTEY